MAEQKYRITVPIGLPGAETVVLESIEAGLTDPRSVDAWTYSLRQKVAALVRGKRREKEEKSGKKEKKKPADKPEPKKIGPAVTGAIKYLGGIELFVAAGINDPGITTVETLKQKIELVPLDKRIELVRGILKATDAKHSADYLVGQGLTPEEGKSARIWFPYLFVKKAQFQEEPSD